MGLDMYLTRMPRYGKTTAKDVRTIEDYFDWKENEKYQKYTLKEWCGVDIDDLPDKSVIDFYKPFYKKRYSSQDVEQKYGYVSIVEDIGYWRKANEIHDWFVRQVQNGEDDCRYHNEVTEDDLRALLIICKTVFDNSKLVASKIKNGETYKDGKWIPNMEDGYIIEDPSVARALLPTTSGFFFGSTDYDEWYLKDIEHTIKICEEALETTDFETQMIYYCSSW